MKEFGIYIVKKNFERKFSKISNKNFDEENLKLLKRPCVCVKLGGRNWVVPLSSIDPTQDDYIERLGKQSYYEKLDDENPPKAMRIFNDLANTGISGYKSVAQYYNALPMKHKYCRKYLDKTGNQPILSKKIGNEIRGHLINYLSTVKAGKLTGFIKHRVEVEGLAGYKNYPINCTDFMREMYKEFLAQQAQKKYRINRAEKREQTQQYQKDLKNLYLERGEFAPYQDLSSASQSDLSGYVGKESDAVISKETQQHLHTAQSKNQPQQVRQVGQVEQVGLVGQVGQAQKSQNNVKQKAKTPNSAGKR